jgi:beta-lactamase regulating signal transducer with metallopeptidase domain
MSPSLAPACDRLLAALGNGVVQGLLLTLLFGLALRLLRRANAATRHALLFATLLAVAALPVAHALLQPPPPVPAPPRVVSDGSDGSDLASVPLRPTPSPVSPRSAEIQEPAAAPATALAPAPSPARSWHLSLPPRVGFGIVLAWLAIAGLRLARLTAQCRVLSRWKREGQAPPEPLAQAFDRLRHDLGIRRAVTLRICPDLASPVAVGYRWPAVLVPPMVEHANHSDTLAWDRVLRHELAHLRRGDDWSNLVQQVAVAVFFFHPAILWLSRRLTLEREVACDDHVLAARVPRREYALLLTDLAGRMRRQPWSAAPAVWSNPTQLQERIHMILDSKRNASPGLARGRTGAGLAALALAATLTLVATPRLSLARADSPDPAPPELPGSPADATSLAAPAEGNIPADAPPPAAPAAGSITATIPEIPRSKPDDSAPGASSPKHKAPSAPPHAVIRHGDHVIVARPAPHPHPAPVPAAAPAPRRVLVLADAAAAPGTPSPEIPPVPPTPALPAMAPVPPPPPLALVAPGAPAELADRLARLEKLVESLTDPNARQSTGAAGSSTGEAAAAREMESAARQAQLAARAAEKAARPRRDAVYITTEDAAHPEARRRALDEQRRVLRKQIQQLEAQLAKLEAQFDRVNAELDRDVTRADHDDQPAEETTGTNPTRKTKDSDPEGKRSTR